MLLTVCLPLTRLRTALLGAMAAAFVGAVLLLGRFFALTTLGPRQCIALVLLIATAAGLMAAVTWLMRRLRHGKP